MTDQEIERKLRDEFEKLPATKCMRSNIKLYMRKKQFFNLTQEQLKLNNAWIDFKDSRWEEASQQRRDMSAIAEQMTEDEETELVTKLNMLFLLVDMLDTTTMEVNELIHRYDKTSNYCDFTGINELGNACKEKINFMHQFATYQYQQIFAEGADKITEMVRNKVRSIIRKSSVKPA